MLYVKFISSVTLWVTLTNILVHYEGLHITLTGYCPNRYTG